MQKNWSGPLRYSRLQSVLWAKHQVSVQRTFEQGLTPEISDTESILRVGNNLNSVMVHLVSEVAAA